MTLQEAKDQVAKDCGFEDWEHIFSSYNLQKIEQITDEAAELYARSKWDEACDACQSTLSIKADEGYTVYYKPKPEFKP